MQKDNRDISAVEASLYCEHFQQMQQQYDTLLEKHHFSQLLVYSGAPKIHFLDDSYYPFRVRLLAPVAVTITLSSIRMPPQTINGSIFDQFISLL